MGQPALNSYATSVSVPDWHAVPSGDRCIILELAREFSIEGSRRAADLARQIERSRAHGALLGITDVVPSMAAVGIHYQPHQVICAPGELPHRSLARQLAEVVTAPDGTSAAVKSEEIVIPVCYGGEHGPDLLEVARAAGLTPEEVIQLHTGEALNVLMLGFAPGHAYIGQLDARLGIPRRTTPRTRVQRGSIGIANRQTVIYPSDLPGGWNLIGRTPLPIFDIENADPCLLNAGDRVQFVAVSAAEFDALSGKRT